MKPIQFTVTFTGEVPDDAWADSLCIDLNLSSVRVKCLSRDKAPQEVAAIFHEYETVNVDDL